MSAAPSAVVVCYLGRMLALALFAAPAICPEGPVLDAIEAATPIPALRLELRRIAARESRCNPDTHVHPRDHWAGQSLWEGAVARGWLTPRSCPGHERGEPWRWAPRGVLGVSPALTLRFAECTGPEAHDNPLRAVELAVAWVHHLERRGIDTCEERVVVWAGAGVWRSRTYLDRLWRERRQCGPRPIPAWVGAAIADVVRLPVRGLRSILEAA